MIGDFHIHTTFSDGKNTCEEYIKAAIEKGMKKIGFSDHSYTFFDESYCMRRDETELYKRTINSLKQKYSGKIEIYCGIEQDFYTAEPLDGYDYAIGSVHYLKCGGEYIAVDESPEILKKLAYKLGGWHELFHEFFSTAAGFAEYNGIKIIGHFDYLTLYNKDSILFDENDSVYIECAKNAADILIAAGKIFEINTGGMYRGYVNHPYPSQWLINYIISKGGKFILSGDSHNIGGLCANFDEFEAFAEIKSI